MKNYREVVAEELLKAGVFPCQTKVYCRFDKLANGVELNVIPYLEVSLHCKNCQRAHRTIIFKNVGSEGICTPINKCSGFSGKLTSFSFENLTAVFVIDYDFKAFIDMVYKKRDDMFADIMCEKRNNKKIDMPIWAGSGWARIHFEMTCPACKHKYKYSIQTNGSDSLWCKECRSAGAMVHGSISFKNTDYGVFERIMKRVRDIFLEEGGVIENAKKTSLS